MSDNKVQFCIGAFFLGNNIQGGLLQTGAFEVTVNNELVFSKIETGEMPTLPMLAQIFGGYGLNV